MAIHIRKAVKTDAPQAYQLIYELAEFENAPEEVILSLAQFTEDGFGLNPLYFLYVAEEVDASAQCKIVGMALCYFMYSTWKGKILYLDDLIITSSHRRLGIGKRLVDALFSFAKAEQVAQVRWHVLDWNEPAVKFYQQLNMTLEPEWITCKYNQEQIAAYKPLQIKT